MFACATSTSFASEHTRGGEDKSSNEDTVHSAFVNDTTASPSSSELTRCAELTASKGVALVAAGEGGTKSGESRSSKGFWFCSTFSSSSPFTSAASVCPGTERAPEEGEPKAPTEESAPSARFLRCANGLSSAEEEEFVPPNTPAPPNTLASVGEFLNAALTFKAFIAFNAPMSPPFQGDPKAPVEGVERFSFAHRSSFSGAPPNRLASSNPAAAE
mmetsp:Transcript_11920/g.51114  ORF Transcript_11920/g.51114 Transcript_11920/m.51114 type:complete len:216 (-) Transcript_11920:809-1456(-)